MLELRPVGDGGHAVVAVGSDAATLGRGETTNIWVPLVSREHCAVQAVDGGVQVTVCGRNSMVLLPGGKAAAAFKVCTGQVAVAKPGDHIALVTGQFTYVVHSVKEDLLNAATLLVPDREPMSPVREDTDDEADDDGADAALAEVAEASPEAKKKYSFERIPSLPAEEDHDDFFPPPPAGKAPPAAAKPTAPSTAAVLHDLFDDDDDDGGMPPPAKPAAPVLPVLGAGVKRPAAEVDADAGEPATKKAKMAAPACQYGANCTRKNPQHFVDFDHPIGVGPSPAEAAAAAKPACKYGAACTRKNPQHFKDFSHPPPGQGAAAASAPAAGTLAAQLPPAKAPGVGDADPNAVDVTDLALRETRKVNGVVPDRYIPEDELVQVSALSGCTDTYKMKYTCGVYYCTCVAWKFQNRGPDQRTCKHLAMYLGSAFEQARCGLGGGGGADGKKAARVAKFDHKGVLLADKWDEKKNLTGWWLSEKLDGVRALWDGTRFLSRLKNEFKVPKRFTTGFPDGTVLDGELFCGRGLFQKTVGIVKSGESHTGWDTVRYHVFDVPSMNAPFEERLAYLTETIDACNPYVVVVPHTKAKSPDHVKSELDEVLKLNGEGLMARQPGSKYAHSRSGTLLKIKKFLDCEARIIGYEKGKGKHSDKTGSLFCELPNGKKFSVGTGLSDAQRRNPPKVGSVISVKYQNLTDGGIPRFPVYLGVRADAQWPPQK